MPGRRGRLSRVDFEQLPMTFAEFIHLTEPTIESTDIDSLIYHNDLLLHRFEEYLITGGLRYRACREAGTESLPDNVSSFGTYLYRN
jgi:predicted AAA+ superfamily ATPase